MKKVIVTFCLVVALIINLPSDSVLAASLSGVVTSECVSGFDFGEDITGSSPDWTYNTNTRLRSLFNTSSQVIDDFGFFNKLADLNVDFSDSYYLIISTLKVNGYGNLVGGVVVYVLPKSSVFSDFVGYLYLNSNNTFNNINITGTSSSIDTNSLYQVTINQYYYNVGGNAWGSSSVTLSNRQGSRYFDGYAISGGISCESILYSNMPVIDGYLVSLQHSYYNSSNVAITPSYSAYQLYTDLGYGDSGDLSDLVIFDFANLPYYNGSEIIDPSFGGFDFDETTTDNTLAFSDLDILSISDPLCSQNVNSRVSWAMDSSNYDFTLVPDNWKMHYQVRLDYTIQCLWNGTETKKIPDVSGMLYFDFVTDIGSYENLLSGSQVLNIRDLINGNVGNLPELSLFDDTTKKFVGIIGTTQSARSYSATYENVIDYITELFSSNSVYSQDGGFHRVLTNQNSTRLFVAGQTYSFSKLNWSVTLNAFNSGNGFKSRSADGFLNCVTGDSNSQIQPSFTGSDVPVDIVDSSDDVLVPDGNGGYYIVSNGSNNSSVNVNVPSNYTLRVYNGLEEFIAWYNNNPQTAEVSTGFWNSFGIFRNNPALDLYEAYFGFLPSSFKAIILGCATIGIVGGVFSCLRRRIT